MNGFNISVDNGTIHIEEIKSGKTVRQKGRSLLEFYDDFTIVDLETTGLDPRYDDIIEIACVKYRNNHEVDSFHSFIKLELWGGIPTFITELTGITDEMLEGAPAFSEIADSLWHFLDGEIIVGHNVNFDINFLYDRFYAFDGRVFDNDFVDTLRISRWVLKELPHHRLSDLCEHYAIDATHHRAETDCIATHQVYLKLKQDAGDRPVDYLRKRKVSRAVDLREIKGDESLFQIDHPFYQRVCVFTGKLERFTREEAAQIVCNIGGVCANGVTKKTNFLIIGNFDYSSSLIKDGKSNKLKKAEEYILKGQDLQILSEETFYSMLVDSIQNQINDESEEPTNIVGEKKPIKVKVVIKRKK